MRQEHLRTSRVARALAAATLLALPTLAGHSGSPLQIAHLLLPHRTGRKRVVLLLTYYLLLTT